MKKNQKNPTNLLHFQHEGGRVCFKIIIYADSGENLISYTERGVLSRDKGAWEKNSDGSKTKSHRRMAQFYTRSEDLLPTYLGHDLTQCHLFEVGGFAAHVGPCYDDKVAALGDVAVV